MEHESDGDTNRSLSQWNNPQEAGKKLGELEIKRRIETIQTAIL